MQPVLDHGHVALIESWGSDASIVEAARMSTGKGFLGWGPRHHPGCIFGDGSEISEENKPWAICTCSADLPGDEKLLRFLWEHKHATPFEMAGMVIDVQLPIFVVREWHRHRTQSYNEMSARYIPLPDVNYIPTLERLMINASTTNKQAGTIAGAAELTEERAIAHRTLLKQSYEAAQALYEDALAAGVPKELARVHLPVGRYTRMRASANLRNWLAFLALRMDSAAQWEIRQYANAVGNLIAERFPKTWELFMEGRK